MLLTIDTGNTNTVFGLHDGKEWRAQWRTSTHTGRTADEYVVWLSELMRMQQMDVSEITGCIISTVVPQSLFNLRNLSRRYFNVDPKVIGENVNLGVDIHIDNPREVGADRLVNAVGAYMSHGGPLLIVDSGTATTFDVVDETGAFQGGIISPGINLSMQALHDAAAKLPRVAIERPERTIGRNTVEAMQAGVFWGYISLIEGLIDRVKAEYGKPMKVVATGGIASLFHGATEKIDIFDPDVTSVGLLEIHRRNADG
ncbi:type III pantothenate kinase [Pyruvatibacter mobilis]|jgi:type III pantothenate kinase|uniref:Type III pantothenate kinase n=1 Tax=Pyruvatibacter mobilis TaxID=1712261 RepID=A0A845QBP8_9HYPH|nr:type III pantothenate kinase [Pyruvatibacter mobilis]NBG95636.1 type III pantothenate kinase [Pyruvatibacter mobilis]QJD75293.1 type III pantothenate kinase [Pyruvatibacter mobilis]GGD14416.1 type III pantothenate kinase [Pyruvatibacter mobilis]